MVGLRNRTFTLLLSIFIILFMTIPMQASAETTYRFSDTQTSSSYQGGELDISGNHIVWSGIKGGSKQIFYQNLVTGETKQITNVASPKESPAVSETEDGEVTIVWTDKRNHENGFLWDVYSYNLNTGKEKKLNSADGQYVVPRIAGYHVVWHNLTDGKMYVYDLNRQKESYIGEGSYPVVAKGKVVYKNRADGGLNMYNMSIQETTTLLKPPSNQYVNHFTFNGETVLWSQNSLDGEMQYRLLDTTDQNLTIKDLTPFTKLEVRYTELEIGKNYAAWMENKHGVAQIIGVNLQNDQVFQMTSGDTDQKLITINGDLVVMKGDNGKLVYRKTIPIEPQASTSINIIDTNQPSNSNREVKIGPEGGQIDLADQGLTLLIAPDTFKQATKVTVKKGKATVQDSSFTQVGDTWKVEADHPFEKQAQLTIAYDESNVIPEQLPKLGVYVNKDQNWTYQKGQLDLKAQTLTTKMNEPGTFAVLLYDKTFNDIKGHWAKQKIERLASHWILNGVGDNEFKPNQPLTRAEFAKMLVSAQGIKPMNTNEASFTDVDPSHWSYKWIEAAKKAGIVTGNEQGQFLPNKKVSREEMMTMLVRAVGMNHLPSEKNINVASFKDSENISNWARTYVEKAVKSGLIQGANGQVKPRASSTRAEAAVVIYRLIEQEEQKGEE